MLAQAAGCATTLSTMQPADTLPPGGWHVGGGFNVNVPASRVIRALDVAYDLEQKLQDDPGYEPTEDEQRDYLDAAIGLAISAPGVTNDIMVRHGLWDRIDAGVRWTTTGLHLDAKLQFLHHPSGWNGSLSVGYVHHFFDGLLFDALDLLEVDDFSRHDVEVPLIFGRQLGAWGTLWGGPKYVAAWYHLDATLQDTEVVDSPDGMIHYVGGFAGFAAGYRGFRGFVELTVMNMIARPVILGRTVDLGGIVVVPSAGVMVRW
jgi:hypothetical protein